MIDKVREAQTSYLRRTLLVEDLCGQLAEEASELAQTALKVQRIFMGRNLPAMELKEAMVNLEEEISDVALVLELMHKGPNRDIMDAKTARWCRRLEKGDIPDGEEEI